MTDDIRDTLYQTAYLMLKGLEKRKRVRNKFCEGFVVITGPLSFVGMSGIQFDAHLETEEGNLKTSFLVRPKDMEGLENEEYGAWLTVDEIGDKKIAKERRRPNPIRNLAKRHATN